MYEVVFDSAAYRHPLIAFDGTDIAIAVIVILLFLGMKKRYPDAFSRERILPLAIGMAAVFLGGKLLFGYFSRASYEAVRGLYLAGKCHRVEGPVRDVALGYGRMKRQSFRVGGVPFTISDNYITGGYHVTVHKGGPLREGVPVKIVYCEKYGRRVIAKLEVRR